MNDSEKGGLEKASPGFSIYLYCGAHEVTRVAGKQTVHIGLSLRFVLHKKEVDLCD